MPFLRFARDKRGYETTALVHAFRGRQGRTRQKVLYWFRTPPGVKVGRPALDEDAIRWIEEHNPEIDFDWQKILATTPTPAPAADDAKGRRGRRGKPERRQTGTQRPLPAKQPEPTPVNAAPENAPVPGVPEVSPPEETRTAEPAEEAASTEEAVSTAEAVEQLTHPDAEELPAVAPSAIEAILGREQLFRLRARYAELQARINERGGDAAQVEALREKAGPLDPDSWVTAEEAKQGLETFETKIRDIRAALGLRRRRRSHRGGRRRRRAQGQASPTAAQDSTPPSTDVTPGDTET